MWLNIVIFLFSCFVALILFKFGLPTFKTSDDFYRRLLPAIAVILLFLGVNLTMAFLAKLSITQALTQPPVESFEQLQTIGTGEPIVLVGEVSITNDLVTDRDREYVAFVARDKEWKPLDLLIDTADEGRVIVENSSYAHRHWPKEQNGVNRRTVQYLQRKQPVIAVGKTVAMQRLTGEQAGAIDTRIYADMIFGGSHAEMVTHLKRRLWGPRVMMGLNAFGIGAIALMTLTAGFKLLARS